MTQTIVNELQPHETLDGFFADLRRFGGVPAVRGDFPDYDDMVRGGVSPYGPANLLLLRGVGVSGTKPQVTVKGAICVFHSAYVEDGRWFLRVTVGQDTRSFSIPDLRLTLGLDVGGPETAPAEA